MVHKKKLHFFGIAEDQIVSKVLRKSCPKLCCCVSCKVFFVEYVVNHLFSFNNHIGVLEPFNGLGTGSNDFMLSHKMISLSFNGRLTLIFQSFEL